MKKFLTGLVIGFLIPVIIIYFFHDSLFHSEHLSAIDKHLIDTIVKNEVSKNDTKAAAPDLLLDLLEQSNGANRFDQGEFERAVGLMQADGREQEVVDILEEIIRNNPKDEEATSMLANFLYIKLRKTKPEEGKKANLECVQKFPTNALCNGNLTNIFFDTPRASEFFDLCLKNSPNNSICLSNHANWYFKKFKFQEAYDTFKFLESILDSDAAGSISIDPKYLFQGIAESAQAINKKREARDYYDKACGLGLESSCHKLEKLE